MGWARDSELGRVWEQIMGKIMENHELCVSTAAESHTLEGRFPNPKVGRGSCSPISTRVTTMSERVGWVLAVCSQ